MVDENVFGQRNLVSSEDDDLGSMVASKDARLTDSREKLNLTHSYKGDPFLVLYSALFSH